MNLSPCFNVWTDMFKCNYFLNDGGRYMLQIFIIVTLSSATWRHAHLFLQKEEMWWKELVLPFSHFPRRPSLTHTQLYRVVNDRGARGLHSAKLVCSSYVTNEEPLQAGWHIQPVGMHAVDYARSRKKCSRGQTHSPKQNKLLKITVRQKRVCQAVHLLSMKLLT